MSFVAGFETARLKAVTVKLYYSKEMARPYVDILGISYMTFPILQATE